MPASALMTIMINAARKAGRSLARDFGEVEHLQVSVKGPANFVSAADHRAENILYEELSKARHGYCFLMEERGLVEGPDKTHTWIIDPLDGTTNFLHGIPMFAISVALEREGEFVAGLVYNPATGDIYTAERGKGAFLNDTRRLRVAARPDLRTRLSPPASRHRGKPGQDLNLREIERRDARRGRRSPHGRRVHRLRLGRPRPLRRLLGALYSTLGHRGRRRAHSRSRGFVSDTEGRQKCSKHGEIVCGNEAIHAALLKRINARTFLAAPF